MRRLNLLRMGAALTMLWMSAATSAQPNIVVLLVDDAGLMDFGGYGGEARTPNINRLADEGVRFSNYHTTPLCAPSRAALLTGLDSHRTGIGTIPEVLTNSQADTPAYALRLLPGVQTIADRLRASGYETFMTGKWHLGRGPGDLPDAHGFDRSFTLDASGADNWAQKSYMPYYDEAPWFEDGQPARLPDDFYSSRFLVDKMMEYLEARDRNHPFFAYVAFQAIHIPVQAPRAFTDRYEAIYADGWDALRERRFRRAQALGLVPADAPLPTGHPALRPWDTLSPEQQAYYERSMMVNAGMLEAMDHHIGRLIEYLESSGDLADTVIVITSDNGPEFNDPSSNADFRNWMSRNGYHTDLERLGERGSMGAIGPEWASAAAVPGSLFKMYASEGGTRVPLIIRAPGFRQEGFNAALNFVTDVAPTLIELAGLPPIDMDGRSLVPLLAGTATTAYDADEAIGLEVAGNSALFKGRYKLTRNTLPHGDAQWRLHDLEQDPAEARDLSATLPALREQLLADYQRYADEVDVIPLPPDFDIQAQVAINVQREVLLRMLPDLLVGAALITALGGLVYVAYRRRQRQRPRKL